MYICFLFFIYFFYTFVWCPLCISLVPFLFRGWFGFAGFVEESVCVNGNVL